MSHLFDLDASQVAVTTDDWYTPRWIFEAAGITFDRVARADKYAAGGYLRGGAA